MEREEAIELVKVNVKKRNVFLHMLAVESIMRALAKYMGEDVELWGMAGLLHDIDYEKTADDFKNHGILAQEMLKGKVQDEVLMPIKAHNHENSGILPETKLAKALISSDAVSGLIVASALVMPSKKVKDVEVKTIEKKYKDKDFARGADRHRIAQCEDLGLTRDEFFFYSP